MGKLGKGYYQIFKKGKHKKKGTSRAPLSRAKNEILVFQNFRFTGFNNNITTSESVGKGKKN